MSKSKTQRKANGGTSPVVVLALRELMKAKGVKSQAELARKMKLSNGYICDVLAQRRHLSPSVIARLGKAFNMPRTHQQRLSHLAAQAAGFDLPPMRAVAAAPKSKPRPKSPKQTPKRPGQKNPDSMPPGKSKAPVPVPQQVSPA